MGNEEPCPPKKIGRVEQGIANMSIPIKVLVWLFPLLVILMGWWTQVKALPNDIKEIKSEIAEARNDVALHEAEFKHVNKSLLEIKDMLKEMRRDQRRYFYRRTARIDREDGE